MRVDRKRKILKSGVVKALIFTVLLFGCFNLYGQGQTLSALSAEQCLEVAREKQQAGDAREATFFLNAAAEKYWDAKDYQNAIKYYTQSIELNKTISNWNGIAGINCNLGLIYFDMDEFEKSYEYLKQTYDYRKGNNEQLAVISALINISVTLNKMARYDESIAALEEAVNVARDINDYEQMRSCYGMLSETHTKAGNTEKAGEYFHLYKTVHDALLTDTEKRLTEADFRARLAEKERGLAETEKELAETRKRYADYELAERTRELEGLDSVNRELLQSKSKAELMIDNFQANEKISELEKKEIEAQLETEQAKSRVLIVGLCAAFLVVIVVAVFLRQRKKDNQRLAEQNSLINWQKGELESAFAEINQKNEELTVINENLADTQKELAEHQKKLEELVVARTSQLLKALDQARESDRLKSSFFANMSHEIRTPLNAILGFSQMFNNPNITEEQRVMMRAIILSNATQLMRMVEDVVTLSEIDSGLISLQTQECNLHELLNSAMSEAAETAKSIEKEKLEIILNDCLPENLKTVAVDVKKINRILAHLLHNALKHTERGYIVLGCETSPENEKTLHFWVEDTGEGIEEEYFESIFKRFWKQGNPLSQKYRGLGVGLSLCKEFTELMNGDISVTSDIGSGSTFNFTIHYN